jgi:hypothetical protein
MSMDERHEPMPNELLSERALHLLRNISIGNSQEVLYIVEDFGVEILNIEVDQEIDTRSSRRRTSPLLFALEKNIERRGNKCWELILENGADPTKFVHGRTSPVLMAIDKRHIGFISKVFFQPEKWLASPLRPYASPQGAYVILEQVFEAGWEAGASVVLEAANHSGAFDPNLTWSGNYPHLREDLGVYGVRRHRDQQTQRSTFDLVSQAPRSLLYRAAFHHMPRVVNQLLDLGADARTPSRDGQTLIHAIAFGAAAATEDYREEHFDVARQFRDTLHIVLKQGVNYKALDKSGRLPSDILLSMPIARSILNELKATFREHINELKKKEVLQRRGIPEDIYMHWFPGSRH